MAKVKSKRVGRRRRGPETWKQKAARVAKTLLAENEEGREARKAIRGVVKDLKDGKDPAEVLREAFLPDEGWDVDEKPKRPRKKR